MKKSKKLTIIFSIIVAIATIGFVRKEFQNDTFFNISIGKYILENGIDMQEHFSWVQGLTYTYSHWAFDIVIYIIHNIWGFTGLYVGTIIFAIITNVVLFNLLNERSKSPIVTLLTTLILTYFIRGCFTARSQIVSFVCFIIEIYAIEKLIETGKKRYIIILCLLSVIIANFHAATWPLFLVLFLPYIGAAFLKAVLPKSIYIAMKNRAEKKLKKGIKDPKKVKKYEEDVKYYSKFAEEIKPIDYQKITIRENYNVKILIITMIIICFTGLLTPIHDVPYTYIVKSMLGTSNFENNASVDFVAEMQPIIPMTNIAILVFMILFIAFFTFTPAKIKLEHGFLVLGLLFMTLTSVRYVYLLVFLGAYVLADLITQNVNKYLKKEIEIVEEVCGSALIVIILIISVSAFSIYELIQKKEEKYINEETYPVEATEYIKNNLDYKNMRIFNSYDNGSYLMLNEIPVFIDSRLDVYCSEFNDTDVFYDYIQASTGKVHYEDVFTKNNFTHILIKNENVINKYIEKDNNYKRIYEDENYTIYERNVDKSSAK